MVRMISMRKTGGELPCKVPLSYQHPSTTQTTNIGPITGYPLTIYDVPQCSKCARNSQSNWSGFSSGRLQLHTQPNPTSIEAPPGTDVLALHQHLRKSASSLVVQLWTGRNVFSAFFYQARVPTGLTPFCSCGVAKQPNTSSSAAPQILQPGISLGTIREAFQTTNCFSQP
jgi:hypothetical protein